MLSRDLSQLRIAKNMIECLVHLDACNTYAAVSVARGEARGAPARTAGGRSALRAREPPPPRRPPRPLLSTFDLI